ncbi:hypothetical protein [Bradyrhizobium sp. 142]|uniref:hypothetical protein n=1 Tax=Bradyrhizobium sp. 142 TaxID=2782618 RepID=UPI001FF8D86E|nr:hypothetical protein [Bradyrhizobium sp. 142]MCK1727315.1 hypothetical protein [Bradyrhizobium sp. 142]
MFAYLESASLKSIPLPWLREGDASSQLLCFPTPHIGVMMQKLTQFRPEATKRGRWFVAITTGNGPDSHVGDFATEADAELWISTKAKYWPGERDQMTTR